MYPPAHLRRPDLTLTSPTTSDYYSAPTPCTCSSTPNHTNRSSSVASPSPVTSPTNGPWPSPSPHSHPATAPAPPPLPPHHALPHLQSRSRLLSTASASIAGSTPGANSGGHVHQNTLPSRAHSRTTEQQPFGSSRSIDSSPSSTRRASTPNLISPGGEVSRRAPDRAAAHLETCSLVDDASETGSYAGREGARSLVDEPAHTPLSTQLHTHVSQQRPHVQSKSQSRPSLTQIQPARTVTFSRPQPQLQQQTPFQKPQQPVSEPQSQSLASSGPGTGRSSIGRAPKASEARWTPERDEVADSLLNPSFLDHVEYVTCAAPAASNGVPKLALEPDSAPPSQPPPFSPHAVPLLQSALEADLISPFGADIPLTARSNFSIGTFRVLSNLKLLS